MQRENKFRGKTFTGDWVYGMPVKSVNDKVYIIHGATEDAINTQNSVDFIFSEVHPETVGQFTGLQDKAKVDIYEGDVVRFSTWSKRKIEAVVEWDDAGMWLPFRDDSYIQDEQGDPVNSYFTIVGNKHDNSLNP